MIVLRYILRFVALSEDLHRPEVTCVATLPLGCQACAVWTRLGLPEFTLHPDVHAPQPSEQPATERKY